MRTRNIRRNFVDEYALMYPGRKAKNVTFIVTHQCNLRCSYCYQHNKGDGKMSLETAKRCVDILFREDIQGVTGYISPQESDGIILDFIGGEPLLEIDLISDIVDYFRERAMELGHRWATRYMVSMPSNGTLYHDERVQRFLIRNQGRVSIGITLDGDRETHNTCRVDCNGCGSYDKAAKAFESAKRDFGHDSTKFTVAPANVHRVFVACKDMIERFDLNQLHCNCVYEEGWTDEMAGEWYRQLKMLADWMIETGRYQQTDLTVFEDYIGKPLPESETQNWCGGDGRMVAFDVDGTVLPCQRYSELSTTGRPLLRIGDVEHGIGVLSGDRANIELLRGITRQSQSSHECLTCPIASGCGWCSAYNYEVTGTPDKRVTYICPTHKARVMATAYYLNSVYRKEGSNERYALHIPKEWAVPIVGEEEFDMLVRLSEEAENV